ARATRAAAHAQGARDARATGERLVSARPPRAAGMSGRPSRAAGMIALLALLAWMPTPARAQTVEAHLDRSRISLGETTTVRVIGRGATGVKVPEFDAPDGLSIVGSTRQQSFAWVNGRASVENEFRYDLEATRAGHYSIGPILVTVGSQAFRSGAIELDVS